MNGVFQHAALRRLKLAMPNINKAATELPYSDTKILIVGLDASRRDQSGTETMKGVCG